MVEREENLESSVTISIEQIGTRASQHQTDIC